MRITGTTPLKLRDPYIQRDGSVCLPIAMIMGAVRAVIGEHNAKVTIGPTQYSIHDLDRQDDLFVLPAGWTCEIDGIDADTLTKIGERGIGSGRPRYGRFSCSV